MLISVLALDGRLRVSKPRALLETEKRGMKAFFFGWIKLLNSTSSGSLPAACLNAHPATSSLAGKLGLEVGKMNIRISRYCRHHRVYPFFLETRR